MKSQTKRKLISAFCTLYFYALLYATQNGASILDASPVCDVNAIECGYTQFGYICNTIVGVSGVFTGFTQLIVALTVIIIMLIILTFITTIFSEITSGIKKKIK